MERGDTVVNQIDEEAFARDWDAGLTLAELAALHGYAGASSASRAARRLGLRPRDGRKDPVNNSPAVLKPSRGRWQTNGRVQVWVEEAS
jgi:hypothetical protein